MKQKLTVMSIRLLTIGFIVFSIAFEAAAWEYGEGFRDELLYLHSALNYEFDPDWDQSWEKNLMRSNGIKLSFGSISKRELIQDEELLINQFLGNGWWFRAHLNQYGSRYEDKDRSTRYLEFQKKVFRNVYMFISGDMKHEKAEIDGTLGIMYTDDSREKYSRIQFCWDDLVYDERNTMGGDTKKFPLGVQWLLRWEGDNWNMFSDGKYSNGYSRDFPDIKRSSVFYHQEQRNNHVDWKFTYFLTKFSRIEIKISHYNFRESRFYYELRNDYSYLNEINHGTVRYLFPMGVFDQIRLELHNIRQYSRADGYKDYRYKRYEYLPAMFLKRNIMKHTLELGYFSSIYDWDYDDHTDITDYSRSDYIDKVKFGWTYNFSKKAHIQLSVSHVLELKRFGGGGGQFIIIF